MPDMGTELDLTEVVSVAGEAALMFMAAAEAGDSSGTAACVALDIEVP